MTSRFILLSMFIVFTNCNRTIEKNNHSKNIDIGNSKWILVKSGNIDYFDKFKNKLTYNQDLIFTKDSAFIRYPYSESIYKYSYIYNRDSLLLFNDAENLVYKINRSSMDTLKLKWMTRHGYITEYYIRNKDN